jgi:hypothetical protein
VIRRLKLESVCSIHFFAYDYKAIFSEEGREMEWAGVEIGFKKGSDFGYDEPGSGCWDSRFSVQDTGDGVIGLKPLKMAAGF